MVRQHITSERRQMKIGVPKEVKPGEGRVAMLPLQVRELVGMGYTVTVGAGAGLLSGVEDQAYADAGAGVVDSVEAVYAASELIVKVKEIMPEEYGFLRQDHVIFTNVHGAANREQIDRMLEVGLTAIAAEETHPYGSPNSALAGEVGAFEGDACEINAFEVGFAEVSAAQIGVGEVGVGEVGAGEVGVGEVGVGEVGAGEIGSRAD